MKCAFPELRIGCAGWSIRQEHKELFGPDGSHLERYVTAFSAVEINTSFYRPHRPNTYARWAASVPAGFRFAVKVPKTITHQSRLVETTDLLDAFLSEAGELGAKLGPLLVQLPPSLAFEPAVVERFFVALRERFTQDVACEPRHRTWFSVDAEQVLIDFHVARVAADPAVMPEAGLPGGWDGFTYFRLHGSPKVYYSAYSPEYLKALASNLGQRSGPIWCIFDNTALGAATLNALELQTNVSTGVSAS